jgi:hypothetical protein
MVIMRFVGVLLLAVVAVACGAGTHQDASTGSGTGSGDRVAALHTAAECLRRHGIANFADPVLGANGQVFTDRRALESAERGAAEAAENACRRELNAANWNPEQLPPAPAVLVAAGVTAARCMRAHGLPNYQDPTASTVYTPGHGFGVTAADLPPGADKRTPIVQQAMQSCRSLLDEEIKASALDQLAGK